jgi:hypothetical protein
MTGNAVEIDTGGALTPAQQIRLDTLGYLIQLEGAPVIKDLAAFKEICAETAAWIETGQWPSRAPPRLKRIDGGKEPPR